ncbi:MAG: DUF4251 domain-containing protein [Muribaculaceae bacterium]
MNRSIIYIISMLLMATIASCASTKTAEQKAAEKHLTAMMDSLDNKHAIDAINDGNFILLADKISFTHAGGSPISVFENTNFIYVLNGESVIQFAVDASRSALNGLGGITWKGEVSAKKVTTDKKGNTYVQFNVHGSRTNMAITITLYKNSNQAYARVSSNYTNANMSFYGKIQPYNPQ